jgi:hypothetical protein
LEAAQKIKESFTNEEHMMQLIQEEKDHMVGSVSGCMGWVGMISTLFPYESSN